MSFWSSWRQNVTDSFQFRALIGNGRCCKQCQCLFTTSTNSDFVVEEKHVLLHCPRYDNLRKELFENIPKVCPKFHRFMRKEDQYILNSAGLIMKAIARFDYKVSAMHAGNYVK